MATTTFRLLLLALVFCHALVFGATSTFAAQAKVQRTALHIHVKSRNWLDIRQVAPPPIGVLAVAYAKRFVGVPYSWGGNGPSAFDCSGLVRYVYKRFGVDLPHSSYSDFNLGRGVGRWALKPGDLVFFSGLGHVGLYVGHGRFIHAPHSGTSVQISSLRDYAGSYYGARRLVHA